MEKTLLSICVGLALAAACGFRVFVPLLVMSIASLAGHLTLDPAFQWIGSYPALIAFGVATILEILGYYIPWVDHMLDTVATPAAVVAGIIVTASVVTQMSPFLRWTLAVIAGGGAAGLVQSATVATRAASTSVSSGLTNPLVATMEAGLSFVTSFLVVVLPWLAILVIAAFVIAGLFLGKKLWRRWRPAPKLGQG
jgi:Domain of unknown function (DUF4126)